MSQADNLNTTNLSRRSALAGAAAVCLPATAAANRKSTADLDATAPALDPASEQLVKAVRDYFAAMMIINIDPDPQWDDDCDNHPAWGPGNAAEKLIWTLPVTSLIGAQAVLEYLAFDEGQFIEDFGEECCKSAVRFLREATGFAVVRQIAAPGGGIINV
jgi:hypothetical protein